MFPLLPGSFADEELELQPVLAAGYSFLFPFFLYSFFFQKLILTSQPVTAYRGTELYS